LWIYVGEQRQIRIVKSTVVGSKEQGQLKRKVYSAQLCRLHGSGSLKVLEQHRQWSKEGTAARHKKKRSAKVCMTSSSSYSSSSSHGNPAYLSVKFFFLGLWKTFQLVHHVLQLELLSHGFYFFFHMDVVQEFFFR
jgi:hypothetical protein